MSFVNSINPAEFLGQPSTNVTVNKNLTTPGSGAGWSEVKMPLGPAELQLVHACCTPVPPSHAYATTQLLHRTSLSLSIVQSGPILVAWVTDAAQGGGSGPVSAADVSFYSLPNYVGYWIMDEGTQVKPYKVASCTTNTQGYCSVILPEAEQKNGCQLAALARTLASPSGLGAGGDQPNARASPQATPAGAPPKLYRSALLPRSGWGQAAAEVPSYVASMVFDRKLVEPGDSLRVTGFVQAASVGGLSSPGDGWVLLKVWPNFEASVYDSNDRAVAIARLNGTTGSFHAEIAVPLAAQRRDYTLYAHIVASLVDDVDPTTFDFTIDSSSNYLTNKQLTSASFLVAEPRAPTAELRLMTDPWVRPTGVARLNITAVSYIGASVGGSTVYVTWRNTVYGVYGGGSLRGVLQLVTNADGVAAGAIDLAAAAAAANVTELPTGSIIVEVEWAGPTRETITQSAAIRIADGPIQIDILPSLAANNLLPGVSFTVAATVTASADGSEMTGLPVDISLRPAVAGGSDGACATTASCTVPSGARWSASSAVCRLTLPCVGVYELRACVRTTQPGSGSTACASSLLGRNTTEWSLAPLSGRPNPLLELDMPRGYRLGDQPRVWLEIPSTNARLLAVWGTTYGVRSQALFNLPAGQPVAFTLPPLGSECATGCSLTVVLDVPRAGPHDAPALPPARQLPVATLFDPRAPHSVVLTTPITVLRDNDLSVSVTVAPPTPSPTKGSAGVMPVKDSAGTNLAVVEPGETAQITVKVGGVAAAGVDGPVEVTVYVIDKAFLDLVPYGLPRLEQEMLLRLGSHMEVTSLDSYRIAPGSVRAVYDKLMARLSGQDPWLPVDTKVRPSGGLDALDVPDAEYLSKFASTITSRGFWWDVLYTSGDAVALAPALAATRSPPPPFGASQGDELERGDSKAPAAAATTSSSPDADTPRRTSEFVVTPLAAHAMVGPDGRATFNFTAPQNLGAFVIRAFAAAGSKAKYGSGEGKLVVRRRLSLTPSVPPFVRVGDVFEAGVVVTVGSAPATVTVRLQVIDAASSSIQVVGAVNKTVFFTAESGLQQEVRFNFSARAVGTTTLVFAATDATLGGARDALQLEIPVEGQQGDVWVATSFALASNTSASVASIASSPGNITSSSSSSSSSNNAVGWVEGMELPSAVPGSGGVTLTAGVGYLPAIAAVYDNLAASDEARTIPYAQPAILWSTLPAVLSYYDQAASSAQQEAIARAVSDLIRLTNPVYGLQYTMWDGWWPSRVDTYLNAWALLMVQTHAAAIISAEPSAAAASAVSELAPVWQVALERQLVEDVVHARQNNYTYNDWSTLAWVRLALGARWTPSTLSGADASTIQATLSLNNLLAVYRASGSAFSRRTRMVLSLVLLGMGRSNPEPRLVKSTLVEVAGALRVQGRTAYLAAGPGSPSAASLTDQALGLMLLLRSGSRHPLLPKLATYVANPTASGGGGLYYFSAPWISQALAVAALTEYDRARGSSRPSLDLVAEVNGMTVLQAAFRAGGTRPVTNFTAWEDMPPPLKGKPSELDFMVSGVGELTVAASLHFVPTALPSFPTFRGLFLDAALQLLDPATGRPTGPRVAAVPLGSSVAITVQISSPDDLGAVTLSVMMPGGLEVLDPNIFPAAGGSSCFTDFFGGSWRFFYPNWWWWPLCPVQRTRRSVVTFSYAALRAGTSTVTIKAVAATAGTFVVPPVRASVDEQPEVMGMTAAGSVRVCTACAAATPAPPPRVPRACLGDCGGNGVCNLVTGVCQCDEGFNGPDCATVLTVA